MTERSMRDLNLGLRFVLELVVLVALAIFGFGASKDLPLQFLLGVGLPVLVMAVWAVFVSPKAIRRLPDPQRLILEVVVFGAGALAFVAAGLPIPGVLLATAAGISLTLMVAWGQRGL